MLKRKSILESWLVMEADEMKIAVVSLVVLVVLSVNGIAREYTRWGLPEDFKKHTGNNWAVGMKYALDGMGLDAASPTGVWLSDSGRFQGIALPTGYLGPIANMAFGAGSTVLTRKPLLRHAVEFFDQIGQTPAAPHRP